MVSRRGGGVGSIWLDCAGRTGSLSRLAAAVAAGGRAPGLDVRRVWAEDSATAGTIFHRSHMPLSTWFAAIWFVTANGVSGEVARGSVSYETAGSE